MGKPWVKLPSLDAIRGHVAVARTRGLRYACPLVRSHKIPEKDGYAKGINLFAGCQRLLPKKNRKIRRRRKYIEVIQHVRGMAPMIRRVVDDVEHDVPPGHGAVTAANEIEFNDFIQFLFRYRIGVIDVPIVQLALSRSQLCHSRAMLGVARSESMGLAKQMALPYVVHCKGMVERSNQAAEDDGARSRQLWRRHG